MIERGKSRSGHELEPIGDYVLTYRKVHEALLGPTWLDSVAARDHPAMARLALTACPEKLQIQGQRDELLLPAIGRILLDAHVWRHLGWDAKEDGAQLQGALPEEKLRMLRSRARDGDQYEDVFVELSAAAWYASHGWDIDIEELPGRADLRVARRDGSMVWSVECKHMRSSSPHRLASIIKKASRQLQATGPHDLGLLHVHIGGRPIERVMNPRSIPKEILALSSRAVHALQGDKNGGVQSLILVWDDWYIAMNRGNKTLANVTFRRRPFVVEPAVTIGESFPEIMDRIYSGFEMEFQLIKKD